MDYISLASFFLVYSAAVAQLKNLNRLLAAEDQSSDEAVENARLMLNILVFIITIISNFMKLELTVGRIPHIVNSTKHTPSSNHLAAVTSSSPDRTIPDTLRHWQQKAIVLVMEASGVNWLVGKVIFSFILDLCTVILGITFRSSLGYSFLGYIVLML